MRDLRARNQELTEARAELARTAVAAERERFARDLHDLLGHSLSVIAIKAELAGRLLPLRPADAAAEIGDVEQVARQALGEVRDAVSGYRQPTLAGEMEGARVALSAAGIIAELERTSVKLDPDVEAVLAWAVCEGATNVIRHSGASRCQVRVLAGLADAVVEVVDDGRGSARAPDDHGHGLAGLTERAESLRGRMEAGAVPGGGFRLSVSVPVSVATP
jgi:two-component system sensor histidine kinase DesK